MDTIKVEKKERVVEYENQYFQVYTQEVDFGSFKKKYFVSQYGHKSGILILKDESFLLVRQYRLLRDCSVWEIPGGKVEEGEDPKFSAVRECEEETGIRCSNIKNLIQYPLGSDTLSCEAHLFFTNQFEQVREFEPNLQEVDMIRWVLLKEGLEMIKCGEILDHFTMIALLFFQTFRNNKEK